MDDRALSNLRVFNHNSNTDYQRVLTAYAGASWYEQVVTRTFMVTTGNFIPPQPDLIVSALTPGQSSYTAGSGISVTATIKNQGTAATGGFYVSLNSGGSTQSSYVSGLAVGSSTTVSFSFVAPATAQTLTMTATADSTNIIAESNEANNTRSVSVAIVVPAYPDLTVTSVSPAVPSYNAGKTVTISSTIKNQGNAAAGTFMVKFTPEGISSQTQTVTGLAPGTSQTLTWTFAAPTLTTTVNRSLTVQADSTNVISESNENNNTGTGSVTIIGANADLTVTSVTPAAPSYNAGKTVTVSSVIRNQGNAAAGTFVVKLTPEGMSSQTQTVTGLAAGVSQTLTWTFIAPTLTATASRSLTVQVDSTGVIVESDETNNVGTDSVTIIGENPDLTVTALTADASVYKPGERVTITSTVKNNGIIACPAS
jgi:subtilase family serine protease